MKRNDWILITATALYSFLFYRQAEGLNFFIFNLALIIGLCLKERQETLNINWWLAAAGSIATTVCVILYGNTFSVVMNIISLSLLAGLSFSSRSSVILSLLYSWYSYFSSLVFMFIDYAERKSKRSEQSANPYTKKIALVVIPLLVTMLFFMIYRNSSALFNDFAQKLNFDFISWGWVRFTFCGFIVLYGFFYHRQLSMIATLDENALATIQPGQGRGLTLFGKELEIDDENFSGTVLFVLLNVLLLIVNYLDFNYLFVDGSLPAGITYSEFVHQGVGMLIVSIVVAIAIVLFYFRGELNFFRKNKVLKAFAYLWVLQNAAMVALTIFRNELYISEYALTWKRIGVFIYLGLALIGLVTTLVKIAGAKSNNYLFRINGWLFYIAFVGLSFFNWDKVITAYNMQHSKVTDFSYLATLSWTNLPELAVLSKEQTSQIQTSDVVFTEDYTTDYGRKFSYKLYDFMVGMQQYDLRSWSYDRARVYSELNRPEYIDKITSINLTYRRDVSPGVLKMFSKVQELNLYNTQFRDISSLNWFPELKVLDLSYNDMSSLAGIEKLTSLEDINLRGNAINDYTPLYALPNLKILRFEGQLNYNDVQEIKAHLPNVSITY